MRLYLAVLLAVLAPLAAQATEPSPPPVETQAAPDGDIPVEDWKAMAMGRTLSYTIGGELWALERYHPGSNRVTLEFRDGQCLEGVWEHSARFYCFHWDQEGASCFRHVRQGGEILILETEDGVETGAVQVMSGVSDTPLACGMPPIS